jgi:hypothetical protein
MFRPPGPYRQPQTTIHDLPDELYLHIGTYFTHFHRNRDLASLALVSKRWRIIAQEWLLKEPRFQLTHIDKYLHELWRHGHLHPQIRSLEIFSSSEGRIPRDKNSVPKREYTPIRAPLYWSPTFVQKCAESIFHYSQNKRHAKRWITALYHDCIPAIFGVLLYMLPNLRELRLGNTWLMDFPLFSCMLSPDVTAAHIPSPFLWSQMFLSGALESLMLHLQILDVPADMSSLFFPTHANTVFDFRHFENLREVGLTMKALWWWPLRSHRMPPDPREFFPATLEILRISEATAYTSIFLDSMCKAKIGGHFPKLRRMEVYYVEYLERLMVATVGIQAPHPVADVQHMCRNAQIALYLYFPAWGLKTWEIEGSPWRLGEESDVWEWAQQRGFMKAMGPFGVTEEVFDTFEAEWDEDGDATMVT